MPSTKKKTFWIFFWKLNQITHDDQIFTFFVEIRFFDMVWRKILLRKENAKKLCFLTPWKIVILLITKTSNSQVFTKWMFLLWKDNFMCSLHHLKQVWKKKFFQRFILFDPGFCSFCSKNSGKKLNFCILMTKMTENAKRNMNKIKKTREWLQNRYKQKIYYMNLLQIQYLAKLQKELHGFSIF